MRNWKINLNVRPDTAHAPIAERMLDLSLSVEHTSGRIEHAGTFRIDLDEAVAEGAASRKPGGYYVRILRENEGSLWLSQSGPRMNLNRWRRE